MPYRPFKPREYGSTEEALGRVYDAAGGVKRAAYLMQRSESQAAAYADPASTDCISFDNARRLTEFAHCVALAELIAADGAAIVERAEHSDEALTRLMARDESAHGRLMTYLMQRIGRREALTGAEAAELKREIDEMISALAMARRKLEEA